MIKTAKLPINNSLRVFAGVRAKGLSRLPYMSCASARIGRDIVSPFVRITDDDGTANSFVQALADFRLDTARGFISKNFLGSIDVHELAAELEGAAACKMVCAAFTNCPRNCKVKSLVVMDGQHAPCTVVHLRMLREPDSVSNWKIYSVEKEN